MSSSGMKLENFFIPLEEINLATDNFHEQRYIGSGGFGKVYRGQLSGRWQNRTVAIKRLDQNGHQGEREFRNEVEMISRFHHVNIIDFIGYCDESNEMIIVYEYAMNGSVDHHLQDPNKRRCITWTQRLKICIGAARGLDYLHSGLGEHNRVIHRDVKSANILLDDNLVANICDFGLSKSGPRNQPNTGVYTKVAGTQYYVDPAYHESGILKKESDVYSFGVVLFEMLSGVLVYSSRSNGDEKSHSLISLVRRYYPKELDKLVDPYIRDQIDSRCLDKFTEVAYQCISLNLLERPMMERVIERLKEALDIQDDVAALIKSMESRGFSYRKPVASFTIYKCLWKYLEAETTTVFDRLIKIISSAIEDQENNDKMAYWLSVASTLLFLIQKSLKLDTAVSSIRKPSPPTLRFGRMTMAYLSSPSFVNLTETKAKAEAEAEAAVNVLQLVEAKNPALLFKHALTRYLENIYYIVHDNLKKELGALPALCFQAPITSSEVLIHGQSYASDSQFSHWYHIVGCLDALLLTLKINFVPPIIVQKIFAQIFSYINVQLFNSLLLRPECCTFRNGEYVEAGLAELKQWCFHGQQEYVGSTWDKLDHITQAIRFLTAHQKSKLSYDEITNDLCPILSIEQLYRICIIYSNPNYKIQSVSQNVISKMRILMKEDAESNSFLLDDDFSLPDFVDDLSTSLKVKDYANVKPSEELARSLDFYFLYN